MTNKSKSNKQAKIQENKQNPQSNNDEPIECHVEWNKSDSEGEILYDIHYMWNLKWNDDEFTYKTEGDTQS